MTSHGLNALLNLTMSKMEQKTDFAIKFLILQLLKMSDLTAEKIQRI